MSESAENPGSLRALGRIVRYLGRYPGAVALTIGLLLGNIAIEMVLPQVLGDAITQLRWHEEWGAVFDLWQVVALYAALVLVRTGNGFILGPIRNRLIQRTLADIRAELYDALQRLSFRYHDRTASGELISRATTDVWRLQDFLFACLFLSVDIVVALGVTLVLIFRISPVLGWATVATMLPTLVMIVVFARRLQPAWRKVHDLHSAMSTVIQENIAGVRVVKAFARESAEVRKFRGRRDEFLTTLMSTVNYWAARVPLAQFVFGLGMPLVLWLGGRAVVRGDLPLGDLAKVLFYLMALGHRMGMIGQFTNILQNAAASSGRIVEILNEPREIVPGSGRLPEGRGAVALEGVSFRYGDGPRVLDAVTLEIPAGSATVLVGPTGSGKSTVAQLISRLYDPVEGRITIDGADLRTLDLTELRRSVGIVFQESFLFGATVAENIAYGIPGASREAIERAATIAQAHEFISGLESGYDTVIGERGVTLSGGQRQRIAIARALLMAPRILVLDDATASVDAATERRITAGLTGARKGLTTLIISHRISALLQADSIVVLNEGRVVAQGNHAELMDSSPFYRSFVERQGGEGPAEPMLGRGGETYG